MPERELTWTIGYRAVEGPRNGSEDFHRRTRQWGIELRADGVLLDRGDEIGVWEPRRADDPLLVEEVPTCPFVGPRIGAVALDVWASSVHVRRVLFSCLMKEGRDVIAHRSTRTQWHAIRLQKRSVAFSCGKYSLADGAELITREPSTYRSWMIDAVRTACATVGATPELYWAPSRHNCLRVMDEPSPELPDVPVDLWLLDLAILDQIEQRYLDDNV